MYRFTELQIRFPTICPLNVNSGTRWVQAKQTLWTTIQCNPQCICVRQSKKKKKLHPLCHHTTKLCRIKTCWKRSAAKTLCNLSNLPPTFKSQEPWTWDVLLAPVWCIKYIEMWQAVDVWRMIYKLLVRLVIIIIVSVAHFHSEQTALMQ